MKPSFLIDSLAPVTRRIVPALAVACAVAAPALALQEEEAAAPAQEGSSILDIFIAAGVIGWFIVALSIVALAIAIENFVSLKRDKLAPPELIDEVQALFDEGQFQEAMELCENEPTFFTRICGAGIAKIGHDFEVIEKSIEEMGDEEAVRLHQKIGWLAMLANIAPMMGLLGTVSGMVAAFNTIAASGGQASPAELAGGISQALLTTLFGLVVEDLFERFRPTAN
jgi:biopolymer transport protein ExbB